MNVDDEDEERWSVDVWYKPKLRIYCQWKSVKPFVKQNLSNSQRSPCAVTETGRFTVLPEEKRLCLLYDLSETNKSNNKMVLFVVVVVFR